VKGSCISCFKLPVEITVSLHFLCWPRNSAFIWMAKQKLSCWSCQCGCAGATSDYY